MSKILELRLYDNAIDFINKSTESFLFAVGGEEREFKYAILLLANGVELILKSILEDKHPLFINESLDNNKDKTVKAENLVQRIKLVYASENKFIGKHEVEVFDSIRIFRNQIIHKDVVFDANNHPTHLYAKTLYALDLVVRRFKNKLLSEVITNWDLIVKIDDIRRVYHAQVNGLKINVEKPSEKTLSVPVPCPLCTLEKLISKGDKIQCFNCSHSFDNIQEVILSNSDEVIREELFLAFVESKVSQGCVFSDCLNCGTEDYSWFDPQENIVQCFSCGILPSNECPECKFNSVVSNEISLGSELTEEALFCFHCNEVINSQYCEGCNSNSFSFQQVSIDVAKIQQFKSEFPYLEFNNGPFISERLCAKCVIKLESLEENGVLFFN
ncbi:hypothetical protein [Bacillus atrophaeus]|uniref:hypothetical protein n=1 Tax=Bacillus atrophaeus TaxID=1452 RepID=UPI002E24E1D7|nr:hypothetical protein [Bacillus atrophaeus]